MNRTSPINRVKQSGWAAHAVIAVATICTWCSSVPAASERGVYSKLLFERAVANVESTAPEFVLIKIANGRSANFEETCTPAPLLLEALRVERGLPGWSHSEQRLKEIALMQPNRTFTFKKSAAFKIVKRLYTDEQLAYARRAVARFPAATLLGAVNAQSSVIHRFYLESAGDSEAAQYAMAHALLEHGVLVGIDDRTRRLYAPE